ncbi:hypothetical protein E7V67_011605 [[Empedobacter] haloabium]|uniref:Chitin-binding type-3 domain-containing protein n=1 Tax=[Empedobacter] haloabium TaxID=592317 RepID=A0ABZ1USM2_9BURK
MTLRIIRPAWADDDLVAAGGMLTASNVLETVPLWNAATAYTVGQRVRRDTTHRIYEAGAASTNQIPEQSTAGSPAAWLDVQATNRFSMLDAVNSTITTNAGSIDVILTPGRANSLYLGGLDAATVDVTVMNGATVREARHYRTLVDNVFSWQEWTDEPIIRATDLTVSDLPIYPGDTVRVVISQPGGVAGCGTLVVGMSRAIGNVLWGAGFRLKTNSVYKDKGFGFVGLVKRPAARKITAQVFVPAAMFDEVNRLMAEYDGQNLVWSFSDKYRSLSGLGYKDDFDHTLPSPGGSIFNLTIMGLI